MEGEVNLEKGNMPTFIEEEPHIESSDKSILNLLNFVWDTYKGFSGWGLRELTHKKGTPWKDSYKEGEKHTPIDDDLIKEYFKKKAKEYNLPGNS